MCPTQGRSFVDAPTDLPAAPDPKNPEKSYLPKKCIHTWSGHTKQVQAIRWMPKTAHLLLSAGMDSKVKIWDVNGTRKCLVRFQPACATSVRWCGAWRRGGHCGFSQADARSVAQRTYIGHTKAVRDICFTNDGARRVSGGHSCLHRLWLQSGDAPGHRRAAVRELRFRPLLQALGH